MNSITYLSDLHLPLWFWWVGGYLALQFGYFIWIRWRQYLDRLRVVAPVPYALGKSDSKTCIVLVHGFADGPQAWQREAECLAERGYYVVVPHLSHAETADVWLAQLETLLRTLRTTHARLILWGHSMGGTLSLILSQRVTLDALVLWAPFYAPRLGGCLTSLLYSLHRIVLLYPWSPTFFPAERYGKGTPATHYRIRRIVSRKTFASVLALPERIPTPPSIPTVLLLSQRDTVVDNRAILAHLSHAHLLWAYDPISSHALTNAADWKENLDATLRALASEQ